MVIDQLGMCPSTLLADPMAVDGDTFRGYIDATAEAGFDAVSLWPFHLSMAGAGAADHVRTSGLRVGAVEAAIGWTGGPTDAALAEIEGLVATATDLGAGIVGAACLGRLEDRGAATAGLGAIAQRAADAGLVVALEFLPWTGVPSFAAALELCTASGADNATVLVDTWHWVRQPGGPDLDLLRSTPGSRVAYVQICDPAPGPAADLEHEAMTGRLPPGAGTVDYPSLWAALAGIGAEPFVAAEVFNATLAVRGPEAMARILHDAGRSVLP